MDSDRRIQKDVEYELIWEPSIDQAHIGVAVDNGVVSLSGKVGDYAERHRAERAALRVRGVKAVANDLEVDIAPRAGRSDAEIAAAAVSALGLWNSIPRDQIKVVVKNGELTLEGDVEWDYQRQAAARVVRELAGVKNVINMIFLRPKVTARDVKGQITAAFHRSAQLDADAIEVQVDGTKVTLRGKVASWEEKRKAEETAWAAPGITAVRNLIEIQDRVVTAF